MSTITTALQDQTPAQIDTELNRLGYERARLVARVDALRKSASQTRGGRYPDHVRAERLESLAAEHAPQISELSQQMKPYSDEYDRRGGWARAFLVQNVGGHVHSSMGCSTCYPGTQYAWLTDYSGKSEDEIVYASGELACTVCYPSAPVDVLKRVGEIRRPGDVERERGAAEKVQRAQAAAAAAVIDPGTGKTLYKTERAATNEIGSALWNLRWYGDDHPEGEQWKLGVAATVDALAAKRGVEPGVLMAECVAKADKKFNSDARKAVREHAKRVGQVVVEDLVPGLQAWVRTNGIPT